VKQGVVVVSAVSPLPVDTGRRVFLSGLVRYLLNRFGPDNVHYGLAAPVGVPTPDLGCEVHRLPVPGSTAKLWNASVHSLVRRRSSLQEAMLWSPRLASAVAELMTRYSPALEIYDTVRMAQHKAPSRPDSRSMVHLDDLYSMRYERMLEGLSTTEAKFTPLGEFAANVPALLRRPVASPRVYRPLLRMEAKLMRRREREIAQEFSCVTLVNAQEVQDLRRRTGLSTIRVITPLLSAARELPRAPSDPPELVFLGLLSLPHNDDAICNFIDSVWPAVLARNPSCQLRVVGRGASPTLRRLAHAHRSSLRLDGFVEDLDTLLSGAAAVVAPLRFGSGIKQKILDAVARGVPVVGTDVAFEGIPARAAPLAHAPTDAAATDGCIYVRKPPDWPEALARVTEAELNEAYSTAARAFFRRTYSPDVVYDQYDSIFRPAK
jgi:glycosyltransferase involved in cell wall biosynthesis